MQQSIDILENYENINQVWIRKDIPSQWINDEIVDNKFKIVKSPHLLEWCGFSFNPGLRRKSDYNKIFPNGLNAHKISKDIGICELECNNVAKSHNYRAAILLEPAVNHIGYNQPTKREK